MLAAVAIILGLALSFAAGGSMRRLASVQVEGEWLMLTLFLVQAVARQMAGDFGSLGLLVWAACSVALLLLLIRQVRLRGLGLAALGVGLNALVVLLNSGMPVVVSAGSLAEARAAVASSAGFYNLADARTLLPLLGDVLPVGTGLASLGDLLLAAGVWTFLVDRSLQD